MKLWSNIQLIVSVLISLAILIWLLYSAQFGLDFTDEGYYLNWIANPFLYDWSVTQFGYVYHSIYLLLGADITLLRQANIVIVLVLSITLIKLYLQVTLFECLQERTLWIISFIFAPLGFLFYTTFFLLTPSYNLLNFQAIMITLIGLILVQKKQIVSSALLMGVGESLIFLAKPSSALMLGLGIILFLITRKQLSIRLVIVGNLSFWGSLVLVALLIDGNVINFIRRLELGVDFMGYLQGGHGLREVIRLDTFTLTVKDKLLSLGLLIYGGTFLLSMRLEGVKGKVLFALCTVSAWLYIIYLFGWGEQSGVGIYARVSLLVIPVMCSLFAMLLLSDFNESLRQYLLCMGILIGGFWVTYSYAFGTGINYWTAMPALGIFWIMSGASFLMLLPDALKLKTIYVIGLFSQLLTVFFLNTAMNTPYRQPKPLRDMLSAVRINDSDLIVSSGFADYIKQVQQQSQLAGMKVGDFVIDLTGQSPGLIYSMGAKSLGSAWLIGGYKGSVKLATVALSRSHCKNIAESWILYGEGWRRLPPDIILSTFGADMADYKLATQWETAAGAGGLVKPRRQWLYRPINSEAIRESCEQVRKDL